MKIIVKNKSIKNADAFLFGIKDLSHENNALSIKELSNLKLDNVFVSIDKNIFNDDLPLLEKTLTELNKLPIKGIFFYDVAVLSISKRLNLTTPLIWNQNFLTTNYSTCNYYKEEGVKGTLLSSEITKDEIIEIANNTDMDLYLNIFGYQLMAISKRKLVSSYFDFINKKIQSKNITIKENNINYFVEESDLGTKFYSPKILNGIKYLKDFEESGIKYIILDDELIEETKFVEVVNIYKKALDKKEDLNLLERDINSILDTSTSFLDQKTIYKVKRND